MDEKSLGKRLQLARKRAGMTQQELCQKAGLSYSTLAKIERGAIRSPSVFTVASIAQATGASVEDLLDLEARGLKPAAPAKKRSKSGVSFVYLDINGTLVRFFHKAFGQIAIRSTQPGDMAETIFWRHHDAVSTGQISLEEFNTLLGKEYGIPDFDWKQYYLDNVEPMPHIGELLKWIADNYEVGILTNSMPGFVDQLRQANLIPDVSFATVVDSSKVGYLKPDPKIYQIAQDLAAVEPQEILLIDDDRSNLMSADKAGWHVLWFDDYQPEESIARVKQALEF